MFKNRVLPAAGIVVVTIGCILLCRVTRVLFFTVLAVMSAYEMREILKNIDSRYTMSIPTVYVVAQAALCFFGAPVAWMMALMGAAAFAAMLWGILYPAEIGGRGAEAVLSSLLWPFAFYAVILYVSASDAWLSVLTIGVLGVWACDSAALSGGRAFGGKKVAPLVSPNKTWAGCYCGAAASLVAGVVFYFLLRSFGGPGLLTCVVTSFVATTAGQVGDLAASLVKRMCDVKDFSNLIPEHGGILDKTDSMLFAIPAAYLCLRIAGAV